MLKEVLSSVQTPNYSEIKGDVWLWPKDNYVKTNSLLDSFHETYFYIVVL